MECQITSRGCKHAVPVRIKTLLPTWRSVLRTRQGNFSHGGHCAIEIHREGSVDFNGTGHNTQLSYSALRAVIDVL